MKFTLRVDQTWAEEAIRIAIGYLNHPEWLNPPRLKSRDCVVIRTRQGVAFGVYGDTNHVRVVQAK